MLTAEQIIDNLKSLLDIKTDLALAKYLDINATTLASWRQRNNFDLIKVYAKICDINMNWLMTGEGEPYTTGEPVEEGKSFIKEQKISYESKISELEVELKKIDCEIGKDNNEVARKRLEIDLLRAKLSTIERLLKLI